MSVGRRSATCSSTVTSATTDRSQIRRPTPRLRKPRAIRSTVTALPRTEGYAKGVRSATRGDMTRVAYTPGVREAIGPAGRHWYPERKKGCPAPGFMLQFDQGRLSSGGGRMDESSQDFGCPECMDLLADYV